jgi:uncharacterized protein (TIGR00369 family)
MVHVEKGQAIFQGTPALAHLNPLGTVHGGWFATLLDSALGCAVHTMMPPGRGYTTAELSVNIVRALTPKVQRVRAEGRVIHCGRQLATADARLVGPDGTLYAHATTTCLVFDLRHPPASGATESTSAPRPATAPTPTPPCDSSTPCCAWATCSAPSISTPRCWA